VIAGAVADERDRQGGIGVKDAGGGASYALVIALRKNETRRPLEASLAGGLHDTARSISVGNSVLVFAIFWRFSTRLEKFHE
jgi:hypothetical protein